VASASQVPPHRPHYERLTAHHETVVYWAMITMSRRLAGSSKPPAAGRSHVIPGAPWTFAQHPLAGRRFAIQFLQAQLTCLEQRRVHDR
jgi:hypothetical protein